MRGLLVKVKAIALEPPEMASHFGMPQGAVASGDWGYNHIPLCNNNVWHQSTSSCAKRNTPQGVVAERRNVMEPWRHPNRKTIRHAPTGAVAKRLGLGRDAIRTQKEVPDWTPLFVCGWRDSNSHRKNSHYPLKVARLPFRHIRL